MKCSIFFTTNMNKKNVGSIEKLENLMQGSL